MITRFPKKLILAALRVTIPRRNANNNHVELIATVGARGVRGTSQILFKIFRDGKEIFRAQEGVEADPESELNYIVTFQAIDTNVRSGSHSYQVTAENITKGTEASIVGPISFSGLAIGSDGRDFDLDPDNMDFDFDLDPDRDLERE